MLPKTYKLSGGSAAEVEPTSTSVCSKATARSLSYSKEELSRWSYASEKIK